MLKEFRSFFTKVQIVVDGRVTPCPQLSKTQLENALSDEFVPYPVHVYPMIPSSWEWAWISVGNAGRAIECWLNFAEFNQQHIAAARQACRAALEDAAALKDKVS
jgi:hypothetical protein